MKKRTNGFRFYEDDAKEKVNWVVRLVVRQYYV